MFQKNHLPSQAELLTKPKSHLRYTELARRLTAAPCLYVWRPQHARKPSIFGWKGKVLLLPNSSPNKAHHCFLFHLQTVCDTQASGNTHMWKSASPPPPSGSRKRHPHWRFSERPANSTHTYQVPEAAEQGTPCLHRAYDLAARHLARYDSMMENRGHSGSEQREEPGLLGFTS